MDGHPHQFLIDAGATPPTLSSDNFTQHFAPE